MKDKLIIFDMDNTLLRSRIDFPKMRAAVYALLEAEGLAQYERGSTANTILAFTESQDYDPILAEEMWRQVAWIENEGLEQSVLEPYALEALEKLEPYCELAVLTNNTDYNLKENLGRLGLLPYLSCVAGRDSVPRLKPSPDGLLWVAAHYPDVPPAAPVSGLPPHNTLWYDPPLFPTAAGPPPHFPAKAQKMSAATK